MTGQPFMQLYVADYLGDTRHLTTEQHGAYLLLLMTMWRHDGRLPNDPSKLARIAGVSARRWHLIADEVMAFFTVEGETITQKRLLQEREKAVSKSQKRSASGKLGGEAKALKSKKPPVANASVLPKHSSEARDHTEEPSGSSKKRADAQFAQEFAEVFWPMWPNKVGKPGALKAFTKARRSHELGTIVAGTDRYVAGKPPDRQWMNPANFLNDERFNDQPAPQPNGGNHDRNRPHAVRGGAGLEDALANVIARKQFREPAQPDREGFDRPAEGVPTRELSFERREDGSYGGGGFSPARAFGGRH